MIDIGDLKWVAGFIEGEGSFTVGRGIRVAASQVEKWPLEKLNLFFPGNLHFREPNGSKKGFWTWSIGSKRNAIALMMTLYSLMSPKRQIEIRKCINYWKNLKRHYNMPFCLKGHRRTPESTYIHPKTGTKSCKICLKAYNKSYQKTYHRKSRKSRSKSREQLSFMGRLMF
jgi:hypothetical protein